MLEQKIVAAILHQTALKEDKDSAASCVAPSLPKWNAEEASKIIMSGSQVSTGFDLFVRVYLGWT